VKKKIHKLIFIKKILTPKNMCARKRLCKMEEKPVVEIIEEKKEQPKGKQTNQKGGKQNNNNNSKGGGKVAAKPKVDIKLENFPPPPFWEHRVAVWDRVKKSLEEKKPGCMKTVHP
jgi:hypothetical protein